jgi:hypothetical protein
LFFVQLRIARRPGHAGSADLRAARELAHRAGPNRTPGGRQESERGATEEAVTSKRAKTAAAAEARKAVAAATAAAVTKAAKAVKAAELPRPVRPPSSSSRIVPGPKRTPTPTKRQDTTPAGADREECAGLPVAASAARAAGGGGGGSSSRIGSRTPWGGESVADARSAAARGRAAEAAAAGCWPLESGRAHGLSRRTLQERRPQEGS